MPFRKRVFVCCLGCTVLMFGSLTLWHLFFEPVHLQESIACSFGWGRLGNQMSSLANLYAMEQEYHVKAFYIERQVKQLRTYFNGPEFETELKQLETTHPDWRRFPWLKSNPDTNNPNRSLWPPQKFGAWQIKDYPNDVWFFKKYLPTMKKIFTMRDVFIQKAQHRLREAKEKSSFSNEEITYISIHVRRTDYGGFMKHFFNLSLVDQKYFERATNHFKDRFQNIIFYVVSDDADWVRQNLENPSANIFYVGTHMKSSISREQFNEEHNMGIDLALLTQANHSIMTYGTFGMWGALLAGGQTILSRDHLKNNITKEMYDGHLDNWTFI